MKEIILSNGQVTLVDDCHFDFLNQWPWQASGSRGGIKYATRLEGRLKMSHLVLELNGIKLPKGLEPDHKDRNSLNNQLNNLRVVTKSQNRHNTSTQENNTSGQRGVNYSVRQGKWQARLSVSGSRLNLGTFGSFELAVQARLAAEKRYL